FFPVPLDGFASQLLRAGRDKGVRRVNTKVPIATHKHTCFSIALALSEGKLAKRPMAVLHARRQQRPKKGEHDSRSFGKPSGDLDPARSPMRITVRRSE